MVSEKKLTEIILNAYESMKNSQREWIETEMLFIELYGDDYLKIKRQFIDKR